MRITLDNPSGKTVRVFNVKGDSAIAVFREDNHKVDVVVSTAHLTEKKIKFSEIGVLASNLDQELEIGQHRLRVVEEPVRNIIRDLASEGLNQREDESWKKSATYIAIGQFVIVLLFFIIGNHLQKSDPVTPPEAKIVNIPLKMPPPVAKIEKPVELVPKKMTHPRPIKVATRVVPKKMSVKRRGVLAAFGSNSRASDAGVDLHAANASRGAGLGGSGGSGGRQSSLYAKGLLSSPVGPSASIEDAGGYNTKGRGGGKAGYGKQSLVGSMGDSTTPLSHEALVEGGLDDDLILAVINRNLGQVRYCYEQGLQSEPSLNGRVEVRFTIAGSGQVRTAGVDSTTLHSDTVEGCIVSHLKSWKFPKPTHGLEVHVNYPFLLHRIAGRV